MVCGEMTESQLVSLVRDKPWYSGSSPLPESELCSVGFPESSQREPVSPQGTAAPQKTGPSARFFSEDSWPGEV